MELLTKKSNKTTEVKAKPITLKLDTFEPDGYIKIVFSDNLKTLDKINEIFG